MQLTREMFDALVRLATSVGPVAGEGSAADVLAACERAGLSRGGLITPDGIAALEPYRAKNAVILAAGLSTRFAPVSYERPKGLLRVRGQVLIDRQIEQLLQRGITDITVVTGYKSELFEYLAPKYGVRIVHNPEFASRNNSASLALVAGQLGNTYVCSSDDYFTSNPFDRYVWDSYYSVVRLPGQTDEWCVATDESGRITRVETSGTDDLAMLGHAYLTSDFASEFVPILTAEAQLPVAADWLWERVLARHVDELAIYAREYARDVIHEFDTLDQLANYDPDFLLNFDSGVFDHIEDVLGCDRRSIHDFYPLSEGLTNLSCHFATDTGEYVYRHPGVGTEKLVSRRDEAAGLAVAKKLGLDDTFIYEDPDSGWKISRFVPNARSLDPMDDGELKRAMEMCRALHQSGVELERHFDFYDEGLRYEQSLLEHGPIEIPGYYELRDKVTRLRRLAAADGYPVCISHNDFFYLNFLVTADGKTDLIDWEYAGMSDEANDFGTFTVCCQLDRERGQKALGYYLGHEPTLPETRHFWSFVVFAGWCWWLWSLEKEAEGDDVGELLEMYLRACTDNIDEVLAWYE